jgi:hypothetical protein
MSLKSLLFYAVGFCFLATSQVAAGSQANDGCALPPGLQTEASRRHPGTRPISRDDLDKHDRELFQKEHGARCPGLVSVDFYGDGKPTWALVLVSENGPKRKVELVVAHKVADRWEIRCLETTDGAPVVWREGPGKYNDVYGEKTIRAAHPVIVLRGYESWAILYAWTGEKVEKVWISD